MRLLVALTATLALFFLLLSPFTAMAATSGTHNPVGGKGVLSGTFPPPGKMAYQLYVGQNTQKRTFDNSGDELDVDINVDVFSLSHVLVYTSKKKILGGYYGTAISIPTATANISVAGNSDDTALSLGDIKVELGAINWINKNSTAKVVLAAIMPTGEFHEDDMASPGLGYWTGLLDVGGTYWFDDAKTLSFSVLTHTSISSKQKDTDITPGAEFTVEYGLGKEISVNDWRIIPGLCGTGYWQISDDNSDRGAAVDGMRKRVMSLGTEFTVLHKPTMTIGTLRTLREFGAKNTSKGSAIVFVLTKEF
jgi:hypothetical protein